jgi:hypothetical protein
LTSKEPGAGHFQDGLEPEAGAGRGGARAHSRVGALAAETPVPHNGERPGGLRGGREESAAQPEQHHREARDREGRARARHQGRQVPGEHQEGRSPRHRAQDHPRQALPVHRADTEGAPSDRRNSRAVYQGAAYALFPFLLSRANSSCLAQRHGPNDLRSLPISALCDLSRAIFTHALRAFLCLALYIGRPSRLQYVIINTSFHYGQNYKLIIQSISLIP